MSLCAFPSLQLSPPLRQSNPCSYLPPHNKFLPLVLNKIFLKKNLPDTYIQFELIVFSSHLFPFFFLTVSFIAFCYTLMIPNVVDLIGLVFSPNIEAVSLSFRISFHFSFFFFFLNLITIIKFDLKYCILYSAFDFLLISYFIVDYDFLSVFSFFYSCSFSFLLLYFHFLFVFWFFPQNIIFPFLN